MFIETTDTMEDEHRRPINLLRRCHAQVGAEVETDRGPMVIRALTQVVVAAPGVCAVFRVSLALPPWTPGI